MRTRGRTRRDGTVVVVAAVSLIAVLSVVALSLDGGIMLDQRRQEQAAADAAAIAAADDLFYNWWANTILIPTNAPGLDNTTSVSVTGVGSVTGTAKAAAKAAAAGCGYVDGTNGCTVTVNIPPLSGPFTGIPGHVEVVISKPQRRFFSKMFATTDVPVGARAVSRGRTSTINNGIILLDPTGAPSLNGGGNGTATITGAPALVNSGAVGAILANGGGSGGTLKADEWDTRGTGTTTGGGIIQGPFVPTDPVLDPLRFLPVPDPSTMQKRQDNKLQVSGAQAITLQPGVYNGGINIAGQANVTLNPGIYYMNGGGFAYGGQGNLIATGVMIYNNPLASNDKISIAGSGNVTMSPPTSGPYKGISLFQNRTSTVEMDISGSAGAVMAMTGTFYAAKALLSVTGNGTNQVLGAQYISWDLNLQGNGTYSVNWNVTDTPGTRDVLLVE